MKRAALTLLACGSILQGQVRPFDFAPLPPNKHGGIAETAVSTDHAAALLPAVPGGEVRTWRRAGGQWVNAGTFNEPVTAIALYQNQLALGLRGRIDFHFFNEGVWNFGGSRSLPGANDLPRRIEWNFHALAVLTTPGDIGGDLVHLYQRPSDSSFAFTLTRTLSRGSSSDVEAIALSGTRLAISGSEFVSLHDKDSGGPAFWGQTKVIEDPALASFGSTSLALTTDHLAVPAFDAATLEPVVQTFRKDLGGSGNWGDAGRLPLPPAGVSLFDVATDRSNRLAVLGWPPLAAGTPPLLSGVAQLWFHTVGTGGTPVTLESRRDAGEIAGKYGGFSSSISGGASVPRVVAMTTDRLLLGMPAEDDSEGRAWSLGSFDRNASTWSQAQRLQPGGGPVNLGRSLAIHQRWMVAGMPRDFLAGPLTGSALVWRWDTTPAGQFWVPVAFLNKPAPQGGDEFGTSVDIREKPDGSGALVIVGAPGESSQRGAAYVFDIGVLGSISPAVRLIPSPGVWPQAAGDRFGQAVAIDDSSALLGENGYLAAAGAPGDDDFSADGGSVCLFTLPPAGLGGPGEWSFTWKRFPPPFVSGAQRYGMGSSVDLEGDTLVAANPRQYGANTGLAGVSVFQRDTGGSGFWGLRETLAVPVGGPQGYGAAVSLNPFRRLLVGAPGGSGQNGRAYLYDPPSSPTGNATLAHTLGGTATFGQSFGSSVACDFENLLVGAPATGANGSAWLFGPATIPVSGISSAPPTTVLASWTGMGAGSQFGSAVALSLFTGVVGDPTPFGGTDAPGALHPFRAGDYERFAAALPAGGWKPGQDADGDGAENLLEWTLGSDLLSAASRPAFAMSLSQSTLNDSGLPFLFPYPSFFYARPILPYRTLLLAPSFQRSTNLRNWQNVDPTGSDSSGLHFERSGPRAFYRMQPLYPAGF